MSSGNMSLSPIQRGIEARAQPLKRCMLVRCHPWRRGRFSHTKSNVLLFAPLDERRSRTSSARQPKQVFGLESTLGAWQWREHPGRNTPLHF